MNEKEVFDSKTKLLEEINKAFLESDKTNLQNLKEKIIELQETEENQAILDTELIEKHDIHK